MSWVFVLETLVIIKLIHFSILLQSRVFYRFEEKT
jgi:hypothetical protein